MGCLVLESDNTNTLTMPASQNINKINVGVADYILEAFKMNYKISSFESFSSFMGWAFATYLESPSEFPLQENDIISYLLDGEKSSVEMTFYIPKSMDEIIRDIAYRKLRDKRKQSLYITFALYKNIDKLSML